VGCGWIRREGTVTGKLTLIMIILAKRTQDVAAMRAGWLTSWTRGKFLIFLDANLISAADPARPTRGRPAGPDRAEATRTRPVKPATAAAPQAPFRITVISCCPGSTSPSLASSSSEARAPVDIQNATSARSRCDPNWANSSSNFSSGIWRVPAWAPWAHDLTWLG
jgi:hypothetical protein